jgi:hypothetical protein
MTNPVNTLPQTQGLYSQLSADSESLDSPQISEWKPSGTLFGGSLGFHHPVKLPSSSCEASQEDQIDGSRDSLGMLKVDLESVRMRQIELQERKHYGEEFVNKKSPWRPPGRNSKICRPERRSRKSWTPAVQTDSRSPYSEGASQVRYV